MPLRALPSQQAAPFAPRAFLRALRTLLSTHAAKQRLKHPSKYYGQIAYIFRAGVSSDETVAIQLEEIKQHQWVPRSKVKTFVRVPELLQAFETAAAEMAQELTGEV